MTLLEATLFLLALGTIGGPVAARFHLPVEIVLLLGSSLLSLIPGLPSYPVSPELIFQIFLPPILFSAAYFTSWRDFKHNRRPIALLALGLVIFTSAMVAVCARWLLGLGWAEGFLLGAIVSPPDASAATSIVKKLGAPRRIVTILEGESLVNDATALIIYRLALIAITTGDFSWGDAIGRFVLVAAGGTVVGLLVAVPAFALLRRLRESQPQTVLSLITAFLCFLIAEHLHVSGVIATVTGGLLFGRCFPLLNDSSRARLDAKATWGTVLFAINALVFVLIGLQLKRFLPDWHGETGRQALQAGALVSAAVIAVRLIWIFPATYLPRWLFPSIARKDPTPKWQVIVALGWAGMRGIVSLAAALALPENFAHRQLFLFVTYCVIVTSLVVPGITLPILLRKFQLKDQDGEKEEVLARVETMRAILGSSERWRQEARFPEEILNPFQEQLRRRVNVISGQTAPQGFSLLDPQDIALRRLRREALKAERDALLELRRQGAIHDEVFHSLLDELDLEEIRMATPRL